MVAPWVLFFVVSAFTVQAGTVLKNPFVLDAPLPLINLLQIGGMNDDPATGALFSLPEQRPEDSSKSGNVLGDVQQTTPVTTEQTGEQATPVNTPESVVSTQETPQTDFATNSQSSDTQNAPETSILDTPVPATADNVEQKPILQPTQYEAPDAMKTETKTSSENSQSPLMPDTNFPSIDGVPIATPETPQSSESADNVKSTNETVSDGTTRSVTTAPGDTTPAEAPATAPAAAVEAPTETNGPTPPEQTEPAPAASETGEATPAEAVTPEQAEGQGEPSSVPSEDNSSTTLNTEEKPKTEPEEIPAVSYDEKDMQKKGDETDMNPNDVIQGGQDGMSKMTMDIDQDWLNEERAAEAIQKNLPTGTGFTYNKSAKLLTPVVEQPKVMGGVLQTLIDKEAEIRRRHEAAVQIEHDLRLLVTRETADVVALLSKGSLSELKSAHPLVFARLVEPLKASIALGHMNKSAQNIVNFYDRDWYVRSSPKEKATLLENIRKDTGRPDLFALKVKKPKKMTPEKVRVYAILDEYFNDYQCQKVVRGNQVAKQMLRMFDEGSGLYVAPLYTDVVPTLGSTWMIERFEKFYRQTEFLRGEMLEKAMPQLVGRFMVMVENGTILPTSTEIQLSVYSLAAVLSKIMDGVTEPRNFLGKRKFYGYMGMCDIKCARGIATNVPNGDATKSFVLNKQREILRWISLYLRQDLMRIDTSVQRLLVELMFRTTKDPKFQFSNQKVDLHLKTEYVKKEPTASLLELPRVDRFLTKASGLKDAMQMQMRRFISGYRLPGRVQATPYNAFKSPKKLVASLDDGLLQMVEVVVDIVNLRSMEDEHNLYFQAFNTWVQLQSFHAAIHAFEPLSSKKRTSSKTLGAVFRHLNTSASRHIEAIPKQFLPFTSLLLQICFYIENSVDGYKRGRLNRLKNFVKGLLTLGLKSRMGPSNFTELQSYLEPQVVYNKSRYLIGRAIISNLVQDFKTMFLNKPAIPMPIIQVITMFIGMWVRGSSASLNLADPGIDVGHRLFFVNYMSNKFDLPLAATEIVTLHCAASAPVLHLGCVSRTVRGRLVCKDVNIRTTKRDVLKVMQMMDATFEDPMEIIRIGSDLARRCKALPVRRNVVVKKKDKKPEPYDSAMLFSELAHRYHCYQEQKSLVKQLTKDLMKNKEASAAQQTIDRVFSSVRSLTVRQSQMVQAGPTLVCPFMEDAPAELRERHRQRMVEYATSQLTLRHRAAQAIKNLGSKVADKFTRYDSTNTTAIAPLDSIAGAILVGTRQFNGIMFYGGYAPPEKIPMPQNVQVRPGDGRVVYHGKEFVAELEVLRPLGVKAVVLEKQRGVTRRVYHMDSGKKMDELAFGQEATDFVVRAHLLTTASTLREMGYSIGKFIWCGYDHGWVADFVLHNVVGSGDLPVFNGSFWVLSRYMRVSDLVGRRVPIRNGDRIKDANVENYNVNVYSGDGKPIAKYPARTGSGSSFTKGGDNIFTLDSGYGEVSPAAIHDLIRDAEFDAATNTLILNLDAPGAVLKASPIVNRN
ncbi:uncharacterized protein BXIN_2889 [Babesia sp. Xinjiang]|uniref:uncharacterized protein n=1 Tax=Babesia sp. Xinjiang TaxID=462227 RepID=UPI000A2209BB|nr:uncharacterized protein BXIN_2889 [Babesia sp. Xinjiang]ORM39472.1 hypothetical protein BXIN_2889 [Babesia sp. Xinjiang]